MFVSKVKCCTRHPPPRVFHARRSGTRRVVDMKRTAVPSRRTISVVFSLVGHRPDYKPITYVDPPHDKNQ